MIFRTWTYGTKLKVQVMSGTKDYLFVQHDFGHRKEGFILFKHGMVIIPELGTQGFITFKQGGPTGGYWEFSTT